MRYRVLPLLLLGLAGCRIDVPEGRYTCTPGDPRTCPDGWLCRADPETWTHHCFSTAGDPFCGDGRRDPGTEACDGWDLGGETCLSQGFVDGALTCTAGCALSTAFCVTSLCGDGAVDGAEVCDGTAPAGEACADHGAATGAVICTPACEVSAEYCIPLPTCGDDVRSGDEACDGADLGGVTCADLGYVGGDLGCHPNCTLNRSGCLGRVCGNGVAEADGLGAESCDGTDLRGLACADLGLPGGDLACDPGCRLDASGCDPPPSCGNGIRDGHDACDGDDLGDLSCAALGLWSGTLACHPNCSLDLSGCDG